MVTIDDKQWLVDAGFGTLHLELRCC
ncbi:hypothetical protein O9929_05660 [Vibrio lentus]|nr:hypothetical protein [Vibrio lentus]